MTPASFHLNKLRVHYWPYHNATAKESHPQERKKKQKQKKAEPKEEDQRHWIQLYFLYIVDDMLCIYVWIIKNVAWDEVILLVGKCLCCFRHCYCRSRAQIYGSPQMRLFSANHSLSYARVYNLIDSTSSYCQVCPFWMSPILTV